MWAVPSFSKTEFEDCGKQRLCDVVLCVRVKLPVYESGEIYVPPVMLQNGIDRLRLAAGGLHDCFIGEKSAIPHASFPPFPHKAAVGICGYGSRWRCGCARTVSRFSPVKDGVKRTGKAFPVPQPVDGRGLVPAARCLR